MFLYPYFPVFTGAKKKSSLFPLPFLLKKEKRGD